MDDKRNMITAILLSVAILIGWNFVADKFFPTPDKPDVTKTVAGPNGAAPAAAPGQHIVSSLSGIDVAALRDLVATVRPVATAPGTEAAG